MVNRTALPIEISEISEFNALGLQTRNLTPAYFGDGLGNFHVPANGLDSSHYGKCWIRFSGGTDGNGNTAFTQPVAASLRTDVPPRTNYPVLVYRNPADDSWVIASKDYVRANAAGDNTNALNLLDPAQWQVWLKDIRNFRAFSPSTNDNPSTLITVEPLLFQFDGSLFDGGQTTSDNIQLSSYIPADGTQRLVVMGERPYDRTIQIVAGTQIPITSTQYSLSDVNALAYQFDDYVMPIRALKLANNAGMLKEGDMHADLRQFVNVPQPRGFPLIVNRHIHILENYQEFFTECDVDNGLLEVDGLLEEV